MIIFFGAFNMMFFVLLAQATSSLNFDFHRVNSLML